MSWINHMSNSLRIKAQGRILFSVFNVATHFGKHYLTIHENTHKDELIQLNGYSWVLESKYFSTLCKRVPDLGI